MTNDSDMSLDEHIARAMCKAADIDPDAQRARTLPARGGEFGRPNWLGILYLARAAREALEALEADGLSGRGA